MNTENKQASEQISQGSENATESLDRNEGRTINGVIGGTGSELDAAGERIKQEKERSEQSETSGEKR